MNVELSGTTLLNTSTASTNLSSLTGTESLLNADQERQHNKSRISASVREKQHINIWSTLLKHQRRDSKLQEGVRESCNLIFLGDEKNGQRSLIRRIQGKDISGEVRSFNSRLKGFAIAQHLIRCIMIHFR